MDLRGGLSTELDTRVKVKLSGEQLGVLFARLNTGEQAEFFEAAERELDRLCKNHPLSMGAEYQWLGMAKDATKRQRQAMRNITTFAWEFWQAHCEMEDRKFYPLLRVK